MTCPICKDDPADCDPCAAACQIQPPEAAVAACYRHDHDEDRTGIRYYSPPEDYLRIAMDPSLGDDRLVRLGDLIPLIASGYDPQL